VIYSFKQAQEVSALNLDWQVSTIFELHVGKGKGACFEALGKDGESIEIPPKNLDEVTTLAPKKKQMAGVWILLENIFGQANQALKAVAHISGF